MCNSKCDCRTKKIPRKAYTETINKFNEMKGLLCPIYADTIIEDLTTAKWATDGSEVVNKVLNIMEGHESCSNKVIGYFAALPNNEASAVRKFTIAMSFCVPCDYDVFNHTFAKFWAMIKAMRNDNLLAHCDKTQQVIFSYDQGSPIYYFVYGNAVQHQLARFETKCDKYYNK